MNTWSLLDKLKQQNRLVSGKWVALDKDIAALYGVSLSHLRQMVKRNESRFPCDFAFKISKQEYAFTEEGLIMLSSILKSPQAIQISIHVMRELFGHDRN